MVTHLISYLHKMSQNLPRDCTVKFELKKITFCGSRMVKYKHNQIKSNPILSAQPKVKIETLSHWTLLNFTDVTPSGFRHLNRLRKTFKKSLNSPREFTVHAVSCSTFIISTRIIMHVETSLSEHVPQLLKFRTFCCC